VRRERQKLHRLGQAKRSLAVSESSWQRYHRFRPGAFATDILCSHGHLATNDFDALNDLATITRFSRLPYESYQLIKLKGISNDFCK
jgi:hypothetical protein